MFEFAKNVHNEPKHISDYELLALIVSGDIVIENIDDPRPTLKHKGRIVKAQLVNQGGRMYTGETGSRYRWQIERGKNDDGSRRIRRIQCGRLVWMFEKREVIPDDCLIDHGDGGKLDDSRGNVDAMSHAEHSEKHYGPACDDDF